MGKKYCDAAIQISIELGNDRDGAKERERVSDFSLEMA